MGKNGTVYFMKSTGINYDSPNAISKLLQENGLSMKKRFGQNFLIGKGAKEKIILLLNPVKTDRIWEIGPGIGAMTHMLFGKADKLTVFEIDRGFIRVLRESFTEQKSFEIIEGDFLKTWEIQLKSGGKPDKILGNLPYNCGSVIIASIIEKNAIPEKMIFTLQKEVAQRMAAKPGSSNYSSFSLLCQFGCNVQLQGDLSAGSFFPAPDVVSTIVEMTPHYKYNLPDNSLFFDFIRDIFSARRKTIRNNLKKGRICSKYGFEKVMDVLRQEGIDPGIRGEKLSVDDIVNIVKNIY